MAQTFFDEFTLKCPRKTFLGCLLLKPLKVLKVSFAFFSLNNSSSELIFSLQTLAFCQHSNLLKTSNKF